MYIRPEVRLCWRDSIVVVFANMPSKGNGELVVPYSPLDTPALRDDDLKFSYVIARGEMGVLSFEPYKGTPLHCSCQPYFPNHKRQA